MSEKENKNKEIQESVTAVPEANNEIKETTGADMEVYDDYDVTDLADSVKKKKRFKKRYAVLECSQECSCYG